MFPSRLKASATGRSSRIKCLPIESPSPVQSRVFPLGVKPSIVEGVRSRHSPSSLTFLGDAVWEAFLRVHEFPPNDAMQRQPPHGLHDYNLAVKKHASAVQQAILHDRAMDPSSVSFRLTDEELDILRWAGNSSTVTPPRGVPAGVYKKASALEALVAYLNLTDEARCQEFMETLVGPPSHKQRPTPMNPPGSKARRAKDDKSWN